jgi:quercetin dioxygenase-like cupin family protein
MAVQVKRLDEPDQIFDYDGAGRAEFVTIDDVSLVRSVLAPGWSWDEHVKPHTEGLESCPMHHYEYVVSGRIRYVSDDGPTVEAGPGSYLDIGPGHRAWVVGNEECVVLDWGE